MMKRNETGLTCEWKIDSTSDMAAYHKLPLQAALFGRARRRVVEEWFCNFWGFSRPWRPGLLARISFFFARIFGRDRYWDD